jgi:hypothetical protein
MLTTLSKSLEGHRFLLSEDNFLEDLAKSLSQLDPVRPSPVLTLQTDILLIVE